MVFGVTPETTFQELISKGGDLSIDRMLDKMLGWMKLGGQHDWRLKKCPIDSSLPEFLPYSPEFVSLLFGITGQMALVNIYSSSDTQAPHRNISELSPAALASVSLKVRGICHRWGVMKRGWW